MSDFIVSARKYRPVRFDDVVGQQHVTRTLKNALQNGKLAHAFLFCGPRGVGKTTCARILAKVLNCRDVTAAYEPCDRCSSCQAFNQNASFNITELDAASNNSVEHIRALIEQVRFQPQQGKYKVFIIDEVHMLSQQAFNAFLKTLEEPPPYAVFILATTEKHKIIPTILSRCQVFDFRRIQVADMVAHMQSICTEEGIEADKDALHIIGMKADGALRDALSIFDRIAGFSGKEIRYEDVIDNLNVLDYDYYFRAVDAMLTEDVAKVLLLLDEVMRKGFEADIFINGLAEHLRNLLVCKDPETLQLLEISEGLKDRYRQQAQLTPHTLILTALNMANDCDIEFKQARNKRLHVEMALIKMTYISRAVDLAQLPAAAVPEKKSPGPNDPVSPGPVEAQGLRKPEPEPVPAVEVPENKKVRLRTAPGGNPPATLGEASGTVAGTIRRSVKHAHVPEVKDLDTLAAEMREKEELREKTRVELTLEMVKKQWQSYMDQCEQDSLKAVMRGVGLKVEGHTITVVVSSTFAENMLRQESGLMDSLREALNAKSLILLIEVDKSKAQKMPKRKKPMTDKEKFLKMTEVNPLVFEVQRRFDLRPDEE